jgi:hypothetical protein
MRDVSSCTIAILPIGQIAARFSNSQRHFQATLTMNKKIDHRATLDIRQTHFNWPQLIGCFICLFFFISMSWWTWRVRRTGWSQRRLENRKLCQRIDGPIFNGVGLIKFRWTQSISRNTFKGLVKAPPQNADLYQSKSRLVVTSIFGWILIVIRRPTSCEEDDFTKRLTKSDLS